MTTHTKRRPTIKDLIAKSFLGSWPIISLDGSMIAYLEAVPNLRENKVEARGYVYNIHNQSTSRVFKDGVGIKWLEGNTLSYLTKNYTQISVLDSLIGESTPIYEHHSPLRGIEPFGDGFVFLSSRKNPQKERVGDFIHVECEVPKSAIFYCSKRRALENAEQKISYFEEEDWKESPIVFEITQLLKTTLEVESMVVSSGTNTIYLNCRAGIDYIYEYDTSCFRIQLDPEAILEESMTTSIDRAITTAKVTKLALPGGYRVKAISPDGNRIIVGGPMPGQRHNTRDDLWVLDITASDDRLSKQNIVDELVCITEKLDRSPLEVHWTKSGIYVSHWNESRRAISKLEETGEFVTLDFGDIFPMNFFSINDDDYITFRGFSSTMLEETYFGKLIDGKCELTRITQHNEECSHLDFGTVESIKWKSKDGTEIEGVLRKPSNFDPSKKYPLIVFPHGGPRASSSVALYHGDYFRPSHALLGRGILIFEPNYRGSVGKGRQFMELNHDNLGVGDLWDIESGLDYLISLGFVDETRLGSMGGSQGGYLSAYAGMHTDRFAAVAVNAGVSSWYLYYISSDMRHSIHLEGTPFDPESKEAYIKSAPISAIHKAKTPMLIQHGDKDERISFVSAQELYRALKHKGVPTELFVYPGKGHGFLNPRENYAVMLQVYRWFCHYLLDEKLDLLENDFPPINS